MINPDEIPDTWDEEFYLKANADVRAAVAAGVIESGYEHFVKYGSEENRPARIGHRSTPIDWSANDYMALNPDLREAFKDSSDIEYSLHDHWIRVGRTERRKRVRDKIILDASRSTGVPATIISEMFIQGQFDPQLFPAQYFSSEPSITDLNWMVEKGAALALLTETFRNIIDRGTKNDSDPQRDVTALGRTDSFTHIFLVPWLKTGGADKAVILFANTVAAIAGTRVLVLTTEISDSNWSSRLDSRVAFFELGSFLGRPGEIPVSLSLLEQRDLFAAYLLDNPPNVLHIINSHLGWYLIGKYGLALCATKIFISLYCYDYTSEGEPVGYARWLRYVAPFVHRIFTDNSVFPRQLSATFGVDVAKFVTAWHPVDLPDSTKQLRFNAASRHILWASRLDRQKGVDQLLAIARRCPTLTFHVYGEHVLKDSDVDLATGTLESTYNIIFYGPYAKIEEIRPIEYRAFLYTSLWDGLPNTLIEVGALGLPIVAPNVGGIGDLVSAQTGYLVTSPLAVEEFVAAFRQIEADPELANQRRRTMKEWISERHTERAFRNILQRTDGYCEGSADG